MSGARWRVDLLGGYQPVVRHKVRLPEHPELTRRLLLGAFHPRALHELGIWMRLLGTVDACPEWQLLILGGKVCDWQMAMPKTQLKRLLFSLDQEQIWRDWITPDRPERSFALIQNEGIATMLVIGLPTEEVWEEFECEISLAEGRD